MAVDRRAAGVVVWVAVVAAGCLPDFDDFEVGEESGDGDADGDGDTDADTDVDGDADADSGPCPLPYLLVAVEGFDGEPGRVLRLHLTENATEPCAPIVGTDRVPANPLTVTWLPEGRPEGLVAVAGSDLTAAMDAETGAVVWSRPTDESFQRTPVDLFPIESPEGVPLLMSAMKNAGSSNDVRLLLTRDLGDGHVVDTIDGADGGGPVAMGNLSVTPSPFEPQEILSFREPSPSYAASEVNPWTAERREPPWVAWLSGTWFQTIYALYDGELYRVAWVSGMAAGNEIYYLYQPSYSPGDHASGPTHCSNMECTFVHAVPDPTMNTALAAICEVAPQDRVVVRFRSTATECEVVASEADLGDIGGVRFSRLAVAVGP